jgi:SAM-dependent methyltransferase
MERFVPLQGAEIYIALQRTSYQHPISRRFPKKLRVGPLKLRLAPFYDKWVLPLIERRRGDAIFAKYFDDMSIEYESIKGTLPPRANNILDVGCGIAGIDILLSSHYNRTANIYLVDRSELSKIRYGFGKSNTYYNSLDLTREFLLCNGVPNSQIVTIDIGRNPFPSNVSFDLILSLLSWGFHYPVSTYLDEVHDALAQGGVLILDLRRKANDKRQLAEKFGAEPEVIYKTDKFERVLVRK